MVNGSPRSLIYGENKRKKKKKKTKGKIKKNTDLYLFSRFHMKVSFFSWATSQIPITRFFRFLSNQSSYRHCLCDYRYEVRLSFLFKTEGMDCPLCWKCCQRFFWGRAFFKISFFIGSFWKPLFNPARLAFSHMQTALMQNRKSVNKNPVTVRYQCGCWNHMNSFHIRYGKAPYTTLIYLPYGSTMKKVENGRRVGFKEYAKLETYEPRHLLLAVTI